MEELLRKLIEKGWKPRGEKVKLYGTSKDTFGEDIVVFNGNAGGFKRWGCTYRELVSKESGLWQFVCKNKLVKTKDKKVRYRYEDLEETQNYFSWHGYEYRLIVSALLNVNELERFLLDNIKV